MPIRYIKTSKHIQIQIQPLFVGKIKIEILFFIKKVLLAKEWY